MSDLFPFISASSSLPESKPFFGLVLLLMADRVDRLAGVVGVVVWIWIFGIASQVGRGVFLVRPQFSRANCYRMLSGVPRVYLLVLCV